MRLSRKQFMILTLAAIVTWMLWPRSLEGAFDATGPVSASVVIFDVVEGELDTQTEQYQLEADAPAGEKLEELLGEYSYHLSVESLIGKDSLEGFTVAIHLYNVKGEKLTLVDETGKLSINNMVYRLDYWGSDRSTALCEDVLKILREA